MKINWDGSKYIGIELKWDYVKREVTLLMEGYSTRALKKFQHTPPTKHHCGPTKYLPPEYGQKIQYTTVDMTPTLTDKQKNHIQKVYGKFPYNGRGVNITQLHSLNELSIKATTAIDETQAALI